MNTKDFGCKEYNDLSRRQFIVGSGKLAIGLGALTTLLPRVTLAQSGSSRDVILSIYQRGGCDGLSLVAPYGEQSYYDYRPTIAIPPPDSSSTNKAIDLDGFFGLAQSWAPLMDAYAAGHLLFVHATGLVSAARSHFDNQRNMETGIIESIPLGTGWLGRHLQTTTATRSGNTLRGVALGQAIPLTLAGGPGTDAVPDPGNYGIVGSTKAQQQQRSDFLRSAYATDKNTLLQNSALGILDTIDLLKKIKFDNYVPAGGAIYPNSDMGFALKSAAALIRSDIGVEALTIDVGGWDTHSGAGTNGGWLFFLFGDVAASLAAFHQDLDAAGKMNSTVAVMMSEFGRTAHENASQGTDHGYGGVMLALGGGIAGGRVLSKWPGLKPSLLFQGQDLDITIDYRDVLAEIIAKRLQNEAGLSQVFPDYTPTYQGVCA